jgi:hypothetical protein
LHPNAKLLANIQHPDNKEHVPSTPFRHKDHERRQQWHTDFTSALNTQHFLTGSLSIVSTTGTTSSLRTSFTSGLVSWLCACILLYILFIKKDFYLLNILQLGICIIIISHQYKFINNF